MAASTSNSFTTMGKLDPNLKIITSLLYHQDLAHWEENTLLSGDGNPSCLYMLRYHQERMLKAIQDLPSPPTAMLAAISGTHGLQSIQTLAATKIGNALSDSVPKKLRYVLDVEGNFICEAANVVLQYSTCPHLDFFPKAFHGLSNAAKDNVKWLVAISHIVVEPSFYTRHKTTTRGHYNKAMSFKPEVDESKQVEVLVVNEQGEVMEGCITTPYFQRGHKWVTPAAVCGGNLGTTRRWALEKGLAEEAIVYADTVRVDDIIVLSNGVRGFGYARVVGV